MVCRHKKSKLSEMFPVLLAILPFISYIYSVLTTCSYMFWFFEGKESRQMHMPCLACYSHYLNTYTCNIWGHLHCLVLEKKQNKDFSKKCLKSCNVAQAEQSRGETTRVAFLPSHPPKYLPAHLTRQKLLPDHILAPTLTLTV